MGCLTLQVTPIQSAKLTVEPVEGAEMAVVAGQAAAISVEPADIASLTVMPSAAAELSVTPGQAAELAIGEVCSISGGTIVVLAASDGPLLTKNGGYLLLNPATNPPEN